MPTTFKSESPFTWLQVSQFLPNPSGAVGGQRVVGLSDLFTSTASASQDLKEQKMIQGALHDNIFWCVDDLYPVAKTTLPKNYTEWMYALTTSSWH